MNTVNFFQDFSEIFESAIKDKNTTNEEKFLRFYTNKKDNFRNEEIKLFKIFEECKTFSSKELFSEELLNSGMKKERVNFIVSNVSLF